MSRKAALSTFFYYITSSVSMCRLVNTFIASSSYLFHSALNSALNKSKNVTDFLCFKKADNIICDASANHSPQIIMWRESYQYFIHYHQNFLFICEMISLWDSKFKKTNCNWINYWIFIFYLFNFAVGFVEFTVIEVGVDDVMLTFCEWRSRPKTDRKRSSRCFSRSSARSTFGGDRFLIEFHICAGNF